MSINRGYIFLAAACAALVAGCGEGGEANRTAGGEVAQKQQAGQQQQGTVGQYLGSSQDHSTFRDAVRAAGLEPTFTGTQPYTIFAPTNAAFQAIPGGAEPLMKPEAKGQLTNILTNHIVPGVVTAKDLAQAIERGGGKAQIATVGGTTLTATRNGDAITIAGPGGAQARVAGSEHVGSNGVVHSIDAVLAQR
ncbi:MAG TPA: fasciclin domain-containing protein [Allosphingosinicella sp.]|nr:fasciclin domain-containing protein [Allosphingosinicella sp.]